MTKIEKGEIFWCIKATEESEDYGNDWPVPPREMIVTKNGLDIYRVSRIDNGITNKDPNASCIMSARESHLFLFNNKEEAKKAYIVMTLKKTKQNQQNIIEKINEVSDYLRLI